MADEPPTVTAEEAKKFFETRMSEVPDMIITAPDGTVVDTGKEKDAAANN